jgi:hypothetical protein
VFSLFALTLLRSDHPDAASLEGRVTYVEGEVIAGATVSVYNVSNDGVERVETDATGFYKLNCMKQGRYRIVVKAEGYCQKWVLNVFLFRGEHTRLDLTLTGKTPQGTGCVEISEAKK